MIKKIIGVAVLVITILLIVFMIKSKKRPSFTQQPTSSELKVITEKKTPIQENIMITANGNVMSKWQTEIRSEVSGPITFISDSLLSGALFKKNEVLLKVDKTDYNSKLYRQKANLAVAQEQLFEEQVRSKRAIDDWNSLNSNKAANDYTLRKPQLNSAKVKLQAAKADLEAAQNNLNKTIIKAPYDGFVISRFVDIGEVLQVGTKVADVFSSKSLVLTLPLKNSQVEMILSSQEKQIKIYDINTPEKSWEAKFSRVDQLIDPKSRWRNLFLTIDQKDNLEKELPIQGSFLQAQITLDLDQEFLKIDEKSLSMQGNIWYVDSENLLRKTKPNIAFRNNGYIYLYPYTTNNEPVNLVVFPSSTLLEGVKVSQQKLEQEISYAD